MENSYEVGITNRYSIFLDEEKDPFEVLKSKDAKKKAKVPDHENKIKPETKVKPTQPPRKAIKDPENVKVQSSARPNEENIVEETAVVKPAPVRNERGGDRNFRSSGESREERNNRRNRDNRFQNGREKRDRDGRDQRDHERRERRERDGRETIERDGREPTEPDGRETVERDVRESKENDGWERMEHRFGRGPRDGTKPEFNEFRGRGGGRGGPGRGRFNRGGRGGFESRGRRFDRQSGSDRSGVKPVDKREGSGSYNWGSQTDEISTHLETAHISKETWPEEKPDETQAEINKKVEKVSGSGDDALPNPDEPLELTLDEYKALRGNRQKPTYNLRKAGEGEDLKQWKKMYALEKKKFGEEEEYEEFDLSEYPQRVGRQKHLLDIDIHFADSRRGTRGRGRGAGGPRGFGGRFGSRGGSGVPPVPRPVESRPSNGGRGKTQNAPKVDDEHDFPSLG